MDAMTDREKEIFRQAYESGYKQGFEAGRQQISAYYDEKYRELARIFRMRTRRRSLLETNPRIF